MDSRKRSHNSSFCEMCLYGLDAVSAANLPEGPEKSFLASLLKRSVGRRGLSHDLITDSTTINY
jgi:hypothetical protein